MREEDLTQEEDLIVLGTTQKPCPKCTKELDKRDETAKIIQ